MLVDFAELFRFGLDLFELARFDLDLEFVHVDLDHFDLDPEERVILPPLARAYQLNYG